MSTLVGVHRPAQVQSAETQLDRQVELLSGKKKQLQNELAAVESKLLANRADLKAVEDRIQSLQERIARLPEDAAIGEAHRPGATIPRTTAPSAPHDRSNLNQLESRERELAATHHDDHPQLQAVRQQLADARAKLREEPQPAAPPIAPTPAGQPSRQALEADLHGEQSLSQTLRRREQSLLSQKAKLEGDLRQLLSQEALLAEMPLGGSPQGPLDSALTPNLSVPGPASSPTTAAGRWRWLVLKLGLVIFLLGGLLAALRAFGGRKMLKSRADLEGLWDLPLVAVLPAKNSLAT